MDSTVVYVADKVGAALTGLAASLQAPAEHVYAVLVRQAVAEGILGLSAAAGCLLLLVASLLALRWAIPKAEDSGAAVAVIIVAASAAVMSGIGIPINACDGFLHLYNPEFYAIQSILDALK